jgi:hypothetical protein
MDEDPLSFLQHGTKEDIMTFLKPILDEYRVRKRSTLRWDVVKNEETKDKKIPELQQFPMICSSTQCLFYLGDTRLPHESRIFCFSRPRKAREHVERQHLQFFNANDLTSCPHPECKEVLQGVMPDHRSIEGVLVEFAFHRRS